MTAGWVGVLALCMAVMAFLFGLAALMLMVDLHNSLTELARLVEKIARWSTP